MRGVWHLSWRHALHHRAQTVILVACIAVTILLPCATSVLTADYERRLDARADATPLVAGARGNRFDLTLSALYFRESALPTIPWGELEGLRAGGDCVPIPLHVRNTAQGFPVVGTAPEYFEKRGLRAAAGTLPLVIGDCVLGAEVAEALELSPGGHVFSDQKELYDISRPPALKMRVCGVLARSNSSDDEALFVDVKTAWIVEGLAHGHDDPRTVDENLVLGRAEGEVVLSGAFIEYNEVTPENVASYHFHGEESAMPLSSILVFPRDAKAGTLIKARGNRSRVWQVVAPREVVDDLLSYVFRIKAFLDGYSGVLATITALMTVLVLLLSMRLRRREMETLDLLGGSRFTKAKLYGSEMALVLAASIAFAAVGLGVARLVLPDLIQNL